MKRSRPEACVSVSLEDLLIARTVILIQLCVQKLASVCLPLQVCVYHLTSFKIERGRSRYENTWEYGQIASTCNVRCLTDVPQKTSPYYGSPCALTQWACHIARYFACWRTLTKINGSRSSPTFLGTIQHGLSHIWSRHHSCPNFLACIQYGTWSTPMPTFANLAKRIRLREIIAVNSRIQNTVWSSDLWLQALREIVRPCNREMCSSFTISVSFWLFRSRTDGIAVSGHSQYSDYITFKLRCKRPNSSISDFVFRSDAGLSKALHNHQDMLSRSKLSCDVPTRFLRGGCVLCCGRVCHSHSRQD